MKGSSSCAVMAFLSLLVVGGEAVPLQNSGAFQILQHLGLDRGGSLPDIVPGERIRQEDSPIYYIKLPPVPYYYVNNNLYQPSSASNNVYQPSSFTTENPFEKVAIEFTSNGRPDQIYHFNQPSTSDYWNHPSTAAPSYWQPSRTTPAPTTTTTTPPPPTTTTAKPAKKPWLTLDKYFPYNGRPSGIYIYKPRPAINPNKYKNRYFTHFNY